MFAPPELLTLDACEGRKARVGSGGRHGRTYGGGVGAAVLASAMLYERCVRQSRGGLAGDDVSRVIAALEGDGDAPVVLLALPSDEAVADEGDEVLREVGAAQGWVEGETAIDEGLARDRGGRQEFAKQRLSAGGQEDMSELHGAPR